ncbi:unnamed protein product [Symbiodinium natans]|uniref:Uncharacterized protein n=1 Tax=Symbiodinium natans TaxID=878477 RepID=A0A812SXZ6_9DINO|nr:unnamed protein product [Symbiodinium natans]
MARQAGAAKRRGKVIRCVFPDGREEVRFAALDLKGGSLDLLEVRIGDDEKVLLGKAKHISFGVVGAADADGNVVRIFDQAPNAGVLVQMTFSQGPGAARAWADFINQARQADASKLSKEAAEGGAPQLRDVVDKQEEQVQLLEALVQRKGEQLLQLQEHLEAGTGNDKDLVNKDGTTPLRLPRDLAGNAG